MSSPPIYADSWWWSVDSPVVNARRDAGGCPNLRQEVALDLLSQSLDLETTAEGQVVLHFSGTDEVQSFDPKELDTQEKLLTMVYKYYEKPQNLQALGDNRAFLGLWLGDEHVQGHRLVMVEGPC